MKKLTIRKMFTHGYASPVGRGVYLWNSDKDSLEGPRQWLDELVYEALGEDRFVSSGYDLEGISITIEIKKATRP